MNRVLLVGRLTFDPDLKKTQAGLSVCNLSLATSEKAERGGEQKEFTEYHRLVAWGTKADVIAKSCKKDSLIYVEGKIKTESYEKNGQKLKSTKIIVEQIRFLGTADGQHSDPAVYDQAF